MRVGERNVHGDIMGDYGFLFQFEVLEDVGLENFAHFCGRVSCMKEVDLATPKGSNVVSNIRLLYTFHPPSTRATATA